MFGDLRQLRPVGDRWIFNSNSNYPYSELFDSLWDSFRFFELTEIMRQRDDREFAIALKNMASAHMTSTDIELIKSRVVREDTIPEDAIHLFSTNAATNSFNTLKLNRIATPQYCSHAEDFIKASNVGDANKARILKSVKGFKTSETQGLCSSLILKTTAKYMMTVNIDTSDGLVNGATGILRQIDLDSNSHPLVLWVDFYTLNVILFLLFLQ